jgi:hypothetical protein
MIETIVGAWNYLTYSYLIMYIDKQTMGFIC